MAGKKSTDDADRGTSRPVVSQHLPRDSKTLWRMVLDLDAFIKQVEECSEQQDFGVVVETFAHLQQQILGVAAVRATALPGPKKARRLNIEPAMLVCMQHLNPEDVDKRLAALNVAMNTWSAETNRPAGRRPLFIDAAKQKAFFLTTAAKAKRLSAIIQAVRHAIKDVLGPFYALRQQILKRIAAVKNRGEARRNREEVADPGGRPFWTPPKLARHMGIKADKIHVWIRSGELRAINTCQQPGGRPRYLISAAEVKAFLASRKTTSSAKPSRRRSKSANGITEFF